MFRKIISANFDGFFKGGMLVKSESISKLPIKSLESCSTISVVKLNESLTVYLLVVNGSKMTLKF